MAPRTERSRTAPRRKQQERPETDPLTERFFQALEISGHVPKGITPPEAAAGVLGALLQRLPAAKARETAAALPESLSALLKPFAVDRSDEPARFDHDGFVRLVAAQFEIDEEAALRLSRVVFAAFEYELPVERVVTEVERELPERLRRLWRQDAASAGA
jgi:uncharacterized protein (DUF2267 family)